MSMVFDLYEVIDTETCEVIARYVKRNSAERRADRLNLACGIHRYTVKYSFDIACSSGEVKLLDTLGVPKVAPKVKKDIDKR